MSSSKIVVPQAREALDRFKMEAANEVGVSLKDGYSGELTSKQAGSVGVRWLRTRLPHDTRKPLVLNVQTALWMGIKSPCVT